MCEELKVAGSSGNTLLLKWRLLYSGTLVPSKCYSTKQNKTVYDQKVAEVLPTQISVLLLDYQKNTRFKSWCY